MFNAATPNKNHERTEEATTTVQEKMAVDDSRLICHFTNVPSMGALVL